MTVPHNTLYYERELGIKTKKYRHDELSCTVCTQIALSYAYIVYRTA